MIMQRVGNKPHNDLVVMDTWPVYYRFGWYPSDCDIWRSDVGACVPNILPLNDDCKQIAIMDIQTVGLILSRAPRGDNRLDISLSVCQVVYELKFKTESYDSCGKYSTSDLKGLRTIRAQGFEPKWKTCPGCFEYVPRGVVVCHLYSMSFILRDKNTGLQFSLIKRLHKQKLHTGIHPLQTQILELNGDDPARPMDDTWLLAGSNISRTRMFRGVSHTAVVNRCVSNAAQVTMLWQIEWLMDTVNRQTAGPSLLGENPASREESHSSMIDLTPSDGSVLAAVEGNTSSGTSSAIADGETGDESARAL